MGVLAKEGTTVMMATLVVSNVIQWLVILGLVALVFALLRQVGVLHERLGPAGALVLPGGPSVGSMAPEFKLVALDGRSVTIGPSQGSTLLFFLSPTCPVCKSLLPMLKSMAAEQQPELCVILASDGDEAAQQRMVREAKLETFPLVLSAALGMAYQVSRLPYAVLIDRSGVIAAKGLVNSREHVESLFEARDLGVASIQDYIAARRQP